ncbi:hypothetical protein [Actinacidiphila bryophytorum]|uniref:Uncharacterized protein n=1 Tax=Actinacidiphila bryophytorum TaxID=1436133 RepID=A0A9W4H796_9ACTN|nr:hypothetical protein [Actinacidiphila bryophytorum]MBM9437624.1 hypothetical protein [Actinacidiphila bryophytorum]MBN6547782.1 hypothetical protein [Actinacidiphila bryophytorum]CAG7655712.1 conserved exported hypothetical protein [Actinacidiphila bryophytorum]
MRAGLISAAALAVAALAAAAPAAAAADGPRFTATPATAAPGDTVTLRAFGCAGPATASAPGLFGTVALGPGEGQGQELEQVATVTVGRYAAPGVRHDVAFGCDGGQGTIPVAVEERGAPAPGTVRTGLGGGVTGPGSVKAVAVAALVGATGLVVVRRRRTAVR